MDISIPKETAVNGKELRVALLPDEVAKLTRSGHNMFVQRNAGIGVFVKDKEYQKAGAKILTNSRDIFSKELIVKLKCPSKKEFGFIKNNILFSMLHVEQNPQTVKLIEKSNCIAIAMENIRNKAGERLLHCTDIAGEQGMLCAFNESMKSPGECNVLVLGYGAISSGALKIAYSLGANVKILRKSQFDNIEYYLKNKDIVVNGISWPKNQRDKKKYLIKKNMLKLLNKGSIILDLSVDFPNPIQSCRPTSVHEPYYYVNGVKHICIYGYPALAPISSTKRYSMQIYPIILDIADNGLVKCDVSIRRAIIK